MWKKRKKTLSESSLNSKRIIIQLPSLNLGGAERQAILLASQLMNNHIAQVEIWGFNHPGPVSKLCDSQGIPWRVAPNPWSKGSVRGSSKIARGWCYFRNWLQRQINLASYTTTLRQAKPDVIMPFTMFPNMICGLVWQKTGAKVCIWNQRDEGRGRMGPKWEENVIPNVPLFISNSTHGAEFLKNILHVDPEKIHIIKNGIVLPEPIHNRLEWRSQLKIGDNDFVACMVANLTLAKDHKTLISAWQVVVDTLKIEGREAVLLLAGRKDKAYEELLFLSKQLGLQDQIKFLDRVDDISGLLSSVDLGVHSSYLEGVPNGVLEMMAAGLPVCGTDIPGLREALGEKGFDYLAPIGDVDGLADRILRLIANERLRKNLGALNKERCEAEFNPMIMAEKTAEVIFKGLQTASH